MNGGGGGVAPEPRISSVHLLPFYVVMHVSLFRRRNKPGGGILCPLIVSCIFTNAHLRGGVQKWIKTAIKALFWMQNKAGSYIAW